MGIQVRPGRWSPPRADFEMQPPPPGCRPPRRPGKRIGSNPAHLQVASELAFVRRRSAEPRFESPESSTRSRHNYLGFGTRDRIAASELPASPALRLSVDLNPPCPECEFRVRSGVRQPGQFEELAQSDHVVDDRYLPHAPIIVQSDVPVPCNGVEAGTLSWSRSRSAYARGRRSSSV